MKLTQKRLKELLHYNPKMGIFIRKTKPAQCVNIGDIAGTKNSNGYIEIKIDSKTHKAARLAWLYMEGYWPEHIVDHEDRIKDNNKWKNLRHVSLSCNMRNKNIQRNNTSGITGVSWYDSTKKWLATIGHLGKQIRLGYFSYLIDAAKARLAAEIKYKYPSCKSTSTAYLYIKSLEAD